LSPSANGARAKESASSSLVNIFGFLLSSIAEGFRRV
jgi:hypothetical protein